VSIEHTRRTRPQATIDANQAWSWTERWQRMEAEADADVRAGRTRSFDSGAELLSDLDDPSTL
jgi:hypothetical protein